MPVYKHFHVKIVGYYLIYETNNKTNTIKKKNSLAFCYINEVIKRNAFFHKQQYDIKFD